MLWGSKNDSMYMLSEKILLKNSMALSLPSGTPGYAKRQYFPPFLLEPFPYFACVDCESPAGPSGIQIFNPGIFGTGFCQIPGFFGTGFTLIFNPGIVRNFLRDFSGFLFLLCVLVKSHHFHQSVSLSLSPPLRDAPLLPINSR